MRPTTARIAAVLLATLLVAAACGSSKSSNNAAPATTTPSYKLPAKIASAGVINVAADASYAPNEFFAADGTTVQGMDVDLANALGQELGVKVNVQNAKFDDIIPNLGTRYDLGMSSFTDTAEREQTVDFVTYFSAGTSFLVQKGQNSDLTSLDALCGKKVAVESGTTQETDATDQSAKCTAAGKDKVDVQSYPDQSAANLALSSGRADVVMADSPVAAYQAEQSDGKFEVVGEPYGTAPYGIAIPKGSDYAGMPEAIKAALEKLSSDGTYLTILKKWGVEQGAITNFEINAAGKDATTATTAAN